MLDKAIQKELHALEEEFGLSAYEILDTINQRNRCKIAVRGAIAERHLIRYLEDLRKQKKIDSFEDFDRDGYPDCSVNFASHTFLIECKNVEKEKLSNRSITIDFQRTRNQKGIADGRFYSPEEFAIVAACLWNRTGKWEFRFAATKSLPPHPKYSNRLSPRVTVEIDQQHWLQVEPIWFGHLPDLLTRLIS